MAQTNGTGSARPVDELSTGELVQHASEQFSRLVRDELALVRAELTDKGRHAGLGAGLFGGGGLVAAYGIGVLVLAGMFGLAVVLPLWLAALLVGVALLLLAGLLAVIGRQQVKKAVPPTPNAAKESLRRDMDVVTLAVKERSRS